MCLLYVLSENRCSCINLNVFASGYKCLKVSTTSVILFPQLSPLKEMLDYERSFIESLINCSNSLVQWDFVTSLLHLQTFQISHDAFVKGQKIRERSIAGSKKGAKVFFIFTAQLIVLLQWPLHASCKQLE